MTRLISPATWGAGDSTWLSTEASMTHAPLATSGKRGMRTGAHGGAGVEGVPAESEAKVTDRRGREELPACVDASRAKRCPPMGLPPQRPRARRWQSRRLRPGRSSGAPSTRASSGNWARTARYFRSWTWHIHLHLVIAAVRHVEVARSVGREARGSIDLAQGSAIRGNH
jgi:hypothetical protein